MVNGIALILALIYGVIAVFQVYLALGFPFGEYALGGFHRILPRHLRIVSLINCIILLLMAVLSLIKGGFLTAPEWLSLQIGLWGMTGFMFINTLVNFFSRSTKEKRVMTPISCLSGILSLILALN